MEFRKNKETREKFDKFINNVAIKYNVPIEALNDIKFQSVNNAGASVNENELAKKEWKEKGVESSYFKKWTGNANYVSVNDAKNYNFKTGEKVVVNAYHGTNQELNYFDYNKKGNSTNAKSAKMGFWFVDNKNTADSYADFASVEQPTNELQKELDKAEQKQDWNKFDKLTRRIEEIQFELLSKEPKDRGAKTYEVFIKFSNPYVFDANNNTFIDIQSEINNVIKAAEENGYDGVIIKNLKDKPIEGEYGGQTPDTHYLAFNNTQIKSVDNQGTFDSDNPNIYYQSAMIAGINPKEKVQVIDLSSNFANDQNLTRKDLSRNIKNLIGSKPLSSKDKKALFAFVGRSKRVGKADVYVPDHIANSSKVESQNKGARNTFVNNIVDLIQNSVLIDIDKNRVPKVKPNVDNYLRFYIPVRINSDIYTVRISAENNNKKNVFNILNADVYDVIIDKKMPTSAHSPAKQGSIMKSASNNIMADNSGNFNPDEITIEEMLRDVQDPHGKAYYQSAKESSETADNNDVLGDYLIAGYNLSEITDKLSELYENVNKADIEGNRELSDKFLTKAHILEDAIDVVVGDKKFNNANEKTDIALRAYYVMNNQEIPKSYEEADKKSLYYFTNLQAGCFYNKLFKVEVIMR